MSRQLGLGGPHCLSDFLGGGLFFPEWITFGASRLPNPTMKKTSSPLPLLPTVLLGLLTLSPAHSDAQVLIFTDRAAFVAATAGWSSQTLDFEAQPAGTSIPDPTTLGGFTFSGFGTPNLVIDDTFEASSGTHYLGVSNAGTFNQLSYSDSFVLGFSARNAIGLDIITAEVPGVTLFDNDIRLSIPGIGVARIDADDVDATTVGGDRIFFIGLLDRSNTFTQASLEGSGALGFFNIDTITAATVPEFTVSQTLAIFSPMLLLAIWRNRRASQTRSKSPTAA